MVFEQAIIFGNVTAPVVSTYMKADAAAGGGLSLFIHLILFLVVLMAFYKKNNSFLKGLTVAGFVTGILNVSMTIFGYLSWKYLWIAIVMFFLSFITKNMENK